MLSLISISVFFIGVFTLVQIPLTVLVGYRRLKTNIQFLDGGDPVLLRRIRAHGNFTETVPIALLAMMAAELSGIAHWALFLGGFSLLAGRLMHAITLITKGWGNTRAAGMLLTLAPMIGFGAYSLYRGIQLSF